MVPFYLKSLVLQNLATFKNQKINFRPGLNAIIGETGSGKSLVLEALQFILGGRADKRIVRRESEHSLIEASFFCEDKRVFSFMEQEGFPIAGNEIIIKRLIYKNGATKNYVNHLSCTVNFLSLFSRKFIDLVGQFENQKLLTEGYQLQLLDQFCKHLPEIDEFQKLHREYKQLIKEKEELVLSVQDREQRLDYLNFQLLEMEKLNPSIDDEESLLKKKTTMLNFEKAMKICQHITEVFDGADNGPGLISSFNILKSVLLKNKDLFPAQIERLIEVEDHFLAIREAAENQLTQEIDPLEVDLVLGKIDLYQRLKRRFGGTVQSILQAQAEFLSEKKKLIEAYPSIESMDEKILSLEKILRHKSQKLHCTRVRYSAILEEDLTKRIRSLKMNGATIKLCLEETNEFNDFGRSKISLMAETNPGEGFFRVKDIASGGELSRVLLGLRQSLSTADSISIFLFDEIDTGIGGETGTCIGKALLDVSAHGQVVAITHLPQIARFAESLILVNKEILEKNNQSRTESTVKELQGKDAMRQVRAMTQLD